MTSAPSSNERQHLATAWLLANCMVIVFWPGSPMDWFPLIAFAMLAWPVVAVALLFATMLWRVSVRRRALAFTTALAGTAIGFASWSLGPMFHVWWRQDSYLAEARAALATPPPPTSCGPGPIKVDTSDEPPVRVAFFWFAAHGDVDGIVYDPTGLVETKPSTWLYGARPWHMFGPWYRF